MQTKINLTAEIINVRDIIARVEELAEDLHENTPEMAEFEALQSILVDLGGRGGDKQWEGVWYPVTLIRDSYFTDYVRKVCEDIGHIPRNLPSYIEIDWEATAHNVRVDYSAAEIDGVTYWFR
jgi:hypothetical protein